MSEATQKHVAHPLYLAGYSDAMHSRPATSKAEPYMAGYKAAQETLAILDRNGFNRAGPASFSKKMSIRGQRP